MTRLRRWQQIVLTMTLAGVAIAGCQRVSPPDAGAVPTSASSTAAAPTAATSATPAASHTAAVSPSPSAPITARVAVCPARLDAEPKSENPLPPVNGIADRLVPPTPVRSAVLCSYVGTNMDPIAGQRLSRSRALTSGLANLAQDLRWLPQRIKSQEHACTAVGGPQTNYLLALNLSDGTTAWVAGAEDPNSCVLATNGAFTALSNIGPELTATMRTGHWPGRPAAGDQACFGSGRYGQDRQLVPAGVIGLDICRAAEGDFVRVAQLRSGFTPLVNALNATGTTTSTSSCSMVPASTGAAPDPTPIVSYNLVFRYASGPAVLVRYLKGCTPAIDNSSLQATDDGKVIALVESLIPASRRMSSAPTSQSPASKTATPTG